MEVLVEFDYVAEEPDELTIKKGDVIKEVSQFEEGWFIGNLNGKVGVFPDNFVKTIEAPSSQKKQASVEMVKEPQPDSKRIAEQDYEENRSGSVLKTQRVTGIGLGNIFSGQPIQLKQASLKDVIKESETNSDKTLSVAKGDVSNFSTDHVRARFDYQPKQSDELELHADDLIQVLDRNLPDEGWWKGKNLVTKKVGVFPDNFVVPVQDPAADADDQTQQVTQSTTVNTAPDPPKIAAKPSPLMNNPPNSKSVHLMNAVAQRDAVKCSIPNTHNLASGRSSITTPGSAVASPASTVATTTNGSAGLAIPGAGRLNRWRTSSEHSDSPKCRADGESSDLGNQDAGSDGGNQRLAGLTADRPRQTGRRLPSKFNQPASPTDDDEKRNEADTVKRTVPTTSSPGCLTPANSTSNQLQDDGENARSEVFEASRGNSARSVDTNQRMQRIHSTGNAKQSPLYRSEGTSGSADMTRSQEALTPKKPDLDVQKLGTGKLQSQIEQLHNQYNQQLNESRQQMRDMRRQIELLKEANNQIRADMLQSQRLVAERIQTLMNEVDEAKKQRAADAIELTRLRTVLMQLDAKVIMSPTGLRCRTSPTSRHRNPHADRGGDDNGMQPLDDDDEISEPENIGTHGESLIHKNGDVRLMQHAGMSKSGVARTAVSAVRTRDGNALSYSRN